MRCASSRELQERDGGTYHDRLLALWAEAAARTQTGGEARAAVDAAHAIATTHRRAARARDRRPRAARTCSRRSTIPTPTRSAPTPTVSSTRSASPARAGRRSSTSRCRSRGDARRTTESTAFRRQLPDPREARCVTSTAVASSTGRCRFVVDADRCPGSCRRSNSSRAESAGARIPRRSSGTRSRGGPRRRLDRRCTRSCRSWPRSTPAGARHRSSHTSDGARASRNSARRPRPDAMTFHRSDPANVPRSNAGRAAFGVRRWPCRTVRSSATSSKQWLRLRRAEDPRRAQRHVRRAVVRGRDHVVDVPVRAADPDGRRDARPRSGDDAPRAPDGRGTRMRSGCRAGFASASWAPR